MTCLAVRFSAGSPHRSRVPVSPPAYSNATQSGYSVALYSDPGPGYCTENSPPSATNRGFASIGAPIGGRPQLVGQVYGGRSGVARTDAVTPAATATTRPAAKAVKSRPLSARRTGASL